ncbi:MAG: DUF349 domain-containing protein [Bacteroidetes bacterium]|nr:DUF349 domain-containing protein [Bacteroidota bacterium]
MIDNINNSTDENLKSMNEQQASNELQDLNQDANNMDEEQNSSSVENVVEENLIEEPKIESSQVSETTENSVTEVKIEESNLDVEKNDEVTSEGEPENQAVENIEQNTVVEESKTDDSVSEIQSENREIETVSEIENVENSDDIEVSSKEVEKATTEVSEIEISTEDQPEEPTTEPEISEKVVDEKTETSEEASISLDEPKAENPVEPSITEVPEEKIEEIDYSKLDKTQLVDEFSKILEDTEIQNIQNLRNFVDEIKTHFYKIHNEEIKTLEQQYKSESENGTLDGFKIEPDEKEENLKELLKIFKAKKYEYNQILEKEKEENLQKKLQIIEEIKDLAKGSESLSKTFSDFRELQNRWKNIGLVPQASLKNLWETYHYYVEKFYDFIKINKELRDLDLKKNLENKLVLCEKAEELLIEPSILKAFKSLQKLHDHWREIGPVPREKRDDLWERFKEATTKINIKHQAYFDNLKNEQQNNLEAKIVLCEKVEEIAALEIVKPKEWDDKSKEIIEIQKFWKTIGFATKKENSKIYERFRLACNNFFNKKREYFAQGKEEQTNNLQQKINLCIQADGMKESTDWKKTTDEYIKLQRAWKEIGPVPRKDSDKIWKRFRGACDTFFNSKEKYYSEIDARYSENSNLKLELIKRIEEYQRVEDDVVNLETLKEFQNEWTKIGHVSFKQKDEIQAKYREAVNKQFEKLNLDDSKRNILFYKHKIESLIKSPNGKDKLRREREKMIENIKSLENDIILLDNNIGFFAKTKNAESLIKDVNVKIEKAKDSIKSQKQKLDLLYKAL